MKVLFVTLRSLEINSSVTQSNLGILKGLIELGCKVDAISPSVSTELKQYDPVGEGILRKVNIVNIPNNNLYEKLVLGSNSKFKKKVVNILRKSFYKVSLFDNTIGLLKKVNLEMLTNTQYDCIISTSDPKTSHILVSNLIKQGLKYKVWMQHWGDPMSLDITKENILPRFYVSRVEKKILSMADVIVYVSPLTLEAQKKIFPKYKEKMFYVPLPYATEKIYTSKQRDHLTIGYFGDYNSNVRNIKPLYEVCKNNENYKLIIAGSSNIEISQSQNIKIFPRIQQEKLKMLEEECDILVCICNRYGTQIPGKIYYYAATNKPILVLLGDENKQQIKDFFVKYDRYKFCDNEIISISKGIDELKENSDSFGPIREFSSSNVAKILLEITRKVEGI